MALPIVGFAIQEVLYGVTIHFHLPLYSLLAAEIIQGLLGGFGLMISGCMSYLSDATSVEQRTFRIVVAEMLTYFVSGLSQIGEGYLIRYHGYIPPLCITFGVNVLTLLYIAVPPFLIETVDRRDPADARGFREAGRSMVKLFKFNENGRRWQMILLDFMIFFQFDDGLRYCCNHCAVRYSSALLLVCRHGWIRFCNIIIDNVNW